MAQDREDTGRVAWHGNGIFQLLVLRLFAGPGSKAQQNQVPAGPDGEEGWLASGVATREDTGRQRHR